MRKFITSSVLCFSLLSFTTACERLQPISSPSFEVGVSNPTKIQQVIRAALTKRGWAITAVKSNRVEARAIGELVVQPPRLPLNILDHISTFATLTAQDSTTPDQET